VSREVSPSRRELFGGVHALTCRTSEDNGSRVCEPFPNSCSETLGLTFSGRLKSQRSAAVIRIAFSYKEPLRLEGGWRTRLVGILKIFSQASILLTPIFYGRDINHPGPEPCRFAAATAARGPWRGEEGYARLVPAGTARTAALFDNLAAGKARVDDAARATMTHQASTFLLSPPPFRPHRNKAEVQVG